MLNIDEIKSLSKRLYTKKQIQSSIPYIKDICVDLQQQKYAIIKGIPLSVFCYHAVDIRPYHDIDILISKKSINNIEPILLSNGFANTAHSRINRITMLTSSHQVEPWVKDISPWEQVVVDINFDIFWGEYEGERINIDEFLSDTIEMEIYGVRVKSLPPIKAMIQLILHHYKDMNSIYLLATRKSITYNMFKDVYYLLKNNLDTITLDKLYATSAEYKIIPYVFYVLYYTGQVFADDVLRQYIKAFRTPEGEALLNCYGLCEKERKEWKCDFKTRLESDDLYSLIRDDLNEHDLRKIAFNKRIFMGVTE